MKTLVLCVDRDNDFGEKTDIHSPIIGRKDNLRAAISLGTTDPEDSDTNSVFGAIKVYDDLVNAGQDVAVTTLCGDKNVGVVSDQIFSTQLDEVLELLKPDRVILISDGAEDEYILPIITSRIKVDSVHRVVVKQQQDLESGVYFIAKLFQDEKVQRKMLIPLILVAMVVATFTIFSEVLAVPSIGLPLIILTLAVYFLIRIFHLEKPFIAVGKDLKYAVLKGRYIAIFTTLIALMVGGYGFFIRGYGEAAQETEIRAFSVAFATGALWYLIGAALVYVTGKFVDRLVRKGKVYFLAFPIVLSLIAIGYIGMALLAILNYFALGVILSDADIGRIFVNSFAGGCIGFIGIVMYSYIREYRKVTR